MKFGDKIKELAKICNEENKWQKQKWIKKLKNETHDYSILSYITNSRKFTEAIIETETVYKIPDREIETKSYCY